MPEIHSDQLYDPAAAGAAGQTEHVGGPRHYKGSEAAAKLPWKCPACGGENVGRLVGEGCEHCGSGVGSATHVGVPEFVRREKGVPETHTITRVEQRNSSVDDAFIRWLLGLGHTTPLDLAAQLAVAFKAGWAARGGSAVDGPEEIPTTAADDAPADTVLTGTIQSRTIVAALQYFKDQVLAQHPEEIDTGEWAKPEDIDALIEEIRGRYV